MSTEVTTRASRPVVVGVDGSESSADAARWAARQAAAWGSAVRLVHVQTWPWTYVAGDVPIPADTEDRLRKQSDDLLREVAGHATAAAPDVEVTTFSVMGQAAQHLVEESRRARLVVVGSRGLGGFAGLLTGSVAVTLAAHAHCPVGVVRTLPPETDVERGDEARSVVVGVDGTPASDAVLAFAFDQAAQRGAPLVAVRAWSDMTYSSSEAVQVMGRTWDQLEADERRLLASILAPWQDKHPDVTVRPRVTEGRPAQSLLTVVPDPQLIVVGSRGRGGLRGLLLGSVSQAMIHHAPCPVVVVRTEGHPHE